MAVMTKCLVMALVVQTSLGAAHNEKCIGSECSVEDADDVSMLQTKHAHVTDAPPTIEPGHPGSELETQNKAHPDASKLWDAYNRLTESQRAALVPKDLAPISMEELHGLNASFDPEVALLDAKEDSKITPSKAYNVPAFCSSSKRFDVAGFLGATLNLETCYLFACVSPFKVSSTCGPTFYTNGGGNCKCCDYGSNYYGSNAGNWLYHC